MFAQKNIYNFCGHIQAMERKIGIGRRLRKIKKKTFYVKQGFDKYDKTVKNYFIDMPD